MILQISCAKNQQLLHKCPLNPSFDVLKLLKLLDKENVLALFIKLNNYETIP